MTLDKVRLPGIRKAILGQDDGSHLIVADGAWFGRPIDAQVTDLVMLPPTAAIEGNVLEVVRRDSKICLARAVRPGIGRVVDPGTDWVHFTRINREGFVGLGRFRHLEEVEDE